MRILNSIKSFVIPFFFVVLCIPAFADGQGDNAFSDTAITGKIKAGLMANKMTHATSISVKTDAGHVVLSGTVGSNVEATTAIEIAQSTDGVHSVDTGNLNVKNSKQPLTDAYITAKVKGLFIREKLLSNTQDNAPPVLAIKVETQNGVVYLKGKIENKSQSEKALTLARTVEGVKDVKANLKVKG